MVAVSLVIGLFLAAIVYFLWQWQNESRTHQILDKLPGPKALPLLGNALMFKPNPYEFFQQIISFCRDYGKEAGIMRIWIGPIPMVLVSKVDTVEVLLNSSKHISKSKEYDFVKPWLATGLLTSTGTKWKTRRKLLTPTFHFKILKDFVQVFNEQSKILVAKLEKRALEGKPFDIFPDVTHCALDIICETAMGRNVDAQHQEDSEYVKAVWRMSELIMTRVKAPWLHNDFVFNHTRLGKEHSKCLEILHGFTKQVIKERSTELNEQLSRSSDKETLQDFHADKAFLIGKQKHLALLDMLLIASKSGAELTHDDIQEEVDTFMFEGHDTTAAAISWALFLLGNHQEIQLKVREELSEIFDGDDRPITMDDIKKMKYLDCVTKEALRIFPSVPMMARKIEEDSIIGGHLLPKDTSVLIIVAALHKDPEHFPDPERFDPERWFPENSAKRHPYSYIPFSAGHRNCIGQKFAQNEEKVVLASILRKFIVRSILKQEEIRPLGELISRPDQGVTLSLKYDPIV